MLLEVNNVQSTRSAENCDIIGLSQNTYYYVVHFTVFLKAFNLFLMPYFMSDVCHYQIHKIS